jgi:hypothetical protein
VQIDEAVGDISLTLMGIAHTETISYRENAVPNKHCCDNSKHVSMEIPVLDKHSVVWLYPRRYMTTHCYATTENRVSIEVVRRIE